MKKYTFHPVAELFPLLDDEELRELAASIRANGLLQAIVVHQDQILDGRNRLRACEVAGIAPTFVEWQGSGDPSDWIVANNLHRRHLTTTQRALLGAELKKYFEARALERQLSGKKGGDRTNARDDADAVSESQAAAHTSIKGKAAEHAAKVTGVSTRSIEHAARLVASAAPEVVAAVKAGELKVTAAAAIAKLPLDRQRERLRHCEKKNQRLRLVKAVERPAPAPPRPIAFEDTPALNIDTFKATYKKGPPVSRRAPIHELARLQHIDAVAAFVEQAWCWMNVEWTSDGRTDMAFAMDASNTMTPLIKEFRRHLAAVIERCGGSPCTAPSAAANAGH